MEKRALIAIVVSMVILFAWQYFFTPKTPRRRRRRQTQQKQAGQTQNAPGGPAARQPAAAGQLAPSGCRGAQVLKTPTKLVTVDTSKMTVTLGDLGGGVMSVRLKEYKETVGGHRGQGACAGYRSLSVLPRGLEDSRREDAGRRTCLHRGQGATSW